MQTIHDDAISIMLILLRRFNGGHDDTQIQEGVIAIAKMLPTIDEERLFSDIKQLAKEYPSLFVRQNKTPFAIAYGKVVPA